MRKTKIICTLGPSTDKPGILRQLMLAGMNVARFNFSHSTQPEHKAKLDELIRLREELNLPVAALLDTRGPEIRLKNIKNGSAELKENEIFTLTTDDVVGDDKKCSITYEGLPKDVGADVKILIDDGLIAVSYTHLASLKCS